MEKLEIIELNPDAKLERRIAENKEIAKERVAEWKAKGLRPPARNVNESENPIPYPDRPVLVPDRGKVTGL